MSSIDKTLDERGTRYGEFVSHANITQNLKDVLQCTPNWMLLQADQREALDMVMHKVGRILNGDPDYIDSWHDIIGYVRLVEQRLIKEQETMKQSSFASDTNQAATFGATPEGDRGPAAKGQTKTDPLMQIIRDAKEAALREATAPAEEDCECPVCNLERAIKTELGKLGIDFQVVNLSRRKD